MADPIELDPVDSLGAGAIGRPGERTFLIQAAKSHARLTVLVEKEQVVPAQQQRGETGPGRLPPGQGGHRRVEVDGEAEVGGDLTDALVEVGTAESQPPVERRGVGVGGALFLSTHGIGGVVHGQLRREAVLGDLLPRPERAGTDALADGPVGALGTGAADAVRGDRRRHGRSLGAASSAEQMR